MTADSLSVSELLKVGEEEFDTAIKEMSVKNLMAVISGLQREMSREQEAFNSLSGELQRNKGRNSRQYKQISKDMVGSQQRLTLLMNRSMKCFAQQNSPHSTTNTSNGGGDGSSLRRRNSAKGLATPTTLPGLASGPRSAAIHRSRSMHSVNQPASPSGPSAPSLILASSSSNASAASPKSSGNSHIIHTSQPFVAADGKTNSNSTNILPNMNTSPGPASDKPHVPVIMKPSSKSNAASRVPTGTTTSASSASATALRAPTSATLTPHTPVAGNNTSAAVAAATTTSSAINGVQGVTNVSNKVVSGTSTDAQGSDPRSVENKGKGLYVKRRVEKPGVRPVSNTAVAGFPGADSNPSSSVSSTSANLSSSFQNPSSAPSTAAASVLPPRQPSYSRGKLHVVGSTRASYNTNISPMLLSQPLSKSQGAIHHSHREEAEPAPGSNSSATNGGGGGAGGGGSAGDGADDEFRGLPSVRLLAQSFGSMSALNTAPSSSSGFPRNSRLSKGGAAPSHSSSLLFSPGKGVTRSSSSVGFLRAPLTSSDSSTSQPSTSVSSHRLVFTNKANNNNVVSKASEVQTQQAGQHQQKLNPGKAPQLQQSSHNHINGTPDQQQQQQQQQPQQRIRQINSSRAPSLSSSFSVSSASTTSDVENQLALARARLKNRNSREANANSLTGSEKSSVTSPAVRSPSPTQASSKPSTDPVLQTITSTTAAVGTSLNRTPREDITPGDSRSSISSSTSFTSNGHAIKSVATTSSSPSSSSSSTSSPPAPSGAIYNKSSSNNIQRSRSRDELKQEQEKPARNDRESLLKQIQARRRYDDDDDAGNDVVDGGNFRAISKLSMSMPSLLQPGKCIARRLVCLFFS
ncbi:hypothetical protein PoB_007098100 [Plakobranchus ocellatus]|uniref:Uncharacterized protein n=1 Tax=Plakobranchus ocellatus TaxID=259542 RepID=A0AAV4DKR8_9GAST|nr:hypothetical protein PoB_007098100 [Plakobranchus ocellatus]